MSRSNNAIGRDESAIRVLGTFSCEQFNVRLTDYRGGLQQNWHSHDEPILILQIAGYAREQVGSQDRVARPLDIGVKPAGLRHTDHFSPNGVRVLRVELSPTVVAAVGGLSRITQRWAWMTGSDALSPLLRGAMVLRQVHRTDIGLEDHFYDAFAALLPTIPARNSADAPSWLKYGLDHLQASYTSGVRLTHLAREAQVHPVYFARQFRRFFGCNVGSYVRKLKTRTTADLLTTQPHSLAQIACHTGFSDQAHMTRTFVEELGITPGQFRRLTK